MTVVVILFGISRKKAARQEFPEVSVLKKCLVGFLVLFAFLGSLVLQRILLFQRAPIDFAEQELRGVEYQKALARLLRELIICEYNLTFGNAGRMKNSAQETLLLTSVDDAVLELISVHDRLGFLLKISDAELALRNREHFQPKVLNSEWLSFKGNPPSIDLHQSAETQITLRHLVSDVLEMIRYIGDVSNLILDPDLDSFYLMDSSLVVLPQVQNRVGQLLAEPGFLGFDRSLSEREKVKISIVAEMMRTNDMEKLKSNYHTVLMEDDNFYGKSESLRNLATVHDEFIEVYSALADALEGGSRDATQVASDSLLALAKSVFDKSFDYWNVASSELATLLQSRISYHRTIRRKMFFLSYSTLIFIVVICLWIIRRLIGRMDRLLIDLHRQTFLANNANKEKSQFLANMSHEIRAPLGAIIGFSELMEDPKAPGPMISESIVTIKRNGYYLLKIINEILDLSKVEAGMMVVEKSHFSLEDFLRDIVSLNTPLVQSKGIHLRYHLGPDVPKRLHTDETKLKQILLNLVNNAIKFTDRGEIILTVGLGQDRSLVFLVTDQGRGMRTQDRDKIFHPFEQIDPLGCGAQKGTGLGLALSRKLAHLLGGSLVLKESELGRGSTFMLTVPLSSCQDHAELEQAVDKLPPTATDISNVCLVGMRILLVEDCEDNQRLFTFFLNQAGAEIEVEKNGRLGVQKASEKPFDVILMDLEMPEMNGYEATALLRSQGVSVPIIALTAHGTAEEKNNCMRHGFDDFITKPIGRDTLIERVVRYKLRPK